MASGGKRPSHRLVLQHDPKDDRNYTEVGAMWEHSKGGGFGITIKKGISVSSMDGARLVAFLITEREAADDEHGEREDRAPRDESPRGERGNRSSNPRR